MGDYIKIKNACVRGWARFGAKEVGFHLDDLKIILENKELFEEKLCVFWGVIEGEWLKNQKKKIKDSEIVINGKIQDIVGKIIDNDRHVYPFIFFLSTDIISINKYYGRGRHRAIMAIIADILTGSRTGWKYLVYSVGVEQDEVCRLFTERVASGLNIMSWTELACENYKIELAKNEIVKINIPVEIRNKMDVVLWKKEVDKSKITKLKWESIDDRCMLVRLGTKSDILKEMLAHLYIKKDLIGKKWFKKEINKYIKRLLSSGVNNELVNRNKELIIEFYLKLK